MKISVLIENTKLDGRQDLEAEHGLSLHVAADNNEFLFDTGASAHFAQNAAAMSINIADAKYCVLSHHHYDHGGGLIQFFNKNANAPVYLGESTATEFIFRAFGGFISKPIGLNPALLKDYAKRLIFLNKETEVAPGTHIITSIQKSKPIPKGNAKLFRKQEGKLVPDHFDHEIMLVMEENEKLIVFTGCSHHGILNMMETVTARFPGKKIQAVFGGFHLVGIPLFNTMAGSPAEVMELGRQLLAYPVAMYYTGHCTGKKGFSVLKSVMGERLGYMATGDVFEL